MKRSKRLLAAWLALLLIVLCMPWNAVVLAQGEQTIVLPDASEYPIVQSDARPDGFSYVLPDAEHQTTAPFDAAKTAEVLIVNNIVVAKGQPEKGTYIPTNGFVLSASGALSEKVKALSIGDTITLQNVTIPPLDENYIRYTGPEGTEIKKAISGVNRSRGADEVIVYTPEYGESTNTSEWGAEITVVDGKITAITLSGTGGNAPIPDNGCVVSIHDSIDGQIARDYGHLKPGDPFTVVLETPKYYTAETIKYDALSPTKKEDNPAGFDPDTGEPYPGMRGTDQLIVYDQAYGKVSTETNTWGTELTVDEKTGRVLTKQGGNSPIEEGTFVLSGHGKMSEFLQKIDISSVLITLNRQNGTITLIETPEFLTQSVKEQIDAAITLCENTKISMLDVDYEALDTMITRLNEQKVRADGLDAYIEALDFDGLTAEASSILAVVKEAANAVLPNLKVEKRAVWYRPVEKTEQEVRNTLQYVKDAGFNAIYLESWIEGHTIWKSDIPGIPMYPSLNGFDAMEAYTRIGKEMGIEIHAWVETFFVGAFPNTTPPEYSLPAQHPEWLLKSRFGDTSLAEQTYHLQFFFFNPMEQGARDLVSDIYKELVTKYDIAGINYDYCRFPEADGRGEGGVLNDFGYNENIVNAYKEKYGTDPYTITEDHEEWAQWCHFRAELINTFIYRTTSELKSIDNDLKISAAVVPDYEVAPFIKYQETLDWVEKGYIDEVFTMSYYVTEDLVAKDAAMSQEKINEMAFASTGIGSYLGIPIDMIIKQLSIVRAQNAAGSAVFSLTDLKQNNMGPLIGESIYKEEAEVMPEDVEESIPMILREILRKIDTIYTIQSTDEVSAYPYAAIERVIDKMDGAAFDAIETKAFLSELSALAEQVEAASIDENAKEAILTDLDRASYLLRVHANRLTFLSEQEVYRLSLLLESDAKVGEASPFTMRADILRDGYSAGMDLMNNQFAVVSHSDNIAFDDAGNVTFLDGKPATVTVKLTDAFKLSAVPEDRTFTFTVSLAEAVNEYPDYDTDYVAAPVITSHKDGDTVTDQDVTLAGTGEAGHTVVLDINGKSFEAVVAEDGMFSVNIKEAVTETMTITYFGRSPEGFSTKAQTMTLYYSEPTDPDGGDTDVPDTNDSNALVFVFVSLIMSAALSAAVWTARRRRNAR